MKIETVKISDLTFAEYNPRIMSKHDAEALKNSLKEYGFVDPVVINKDGTIIGGHMRVAAAEQIGMTEVPCVRLDLTKEKEKALNLALNRISGDWDDQKLSEILFELKNEPELILSGFSESEVDSLISSVASTDREIDQNTNKEDLENYKKASIKQVVMFFSADDYEKHLPRLRDVVEENELGNFTDALIFLLDLYEKNPSNQE